MYDPRDDMARLCKLAYDRRLMDTAGGNVTVRVGDRVYMTRSYAGPKSQWDITRDDILVLDMEENILEGKGDFSREGKVHMACYRALPAARCVWHAHPFNIMAFVSRRISLPSGSEQTDKFGTIGFCKHAASGTDELADNVAAALKAQEAGLPDHPIATLIPRHGIFIASTELWLAFDCLERLDRSAHMVVMGSQLQNGYVPPPEP